MDNSMGVRPEKMNAKDVTAEIDRETDLAVGEARGDESSRPGAVVSREQAGQLGNKALFYNAEADKDANYERVVRIAERDNGYGREYREGVATVGEESKREITERLAADRENLKNEDFPNRDKDARIVARSQEEHGKSGMKLASEYRGKGDFEVGELLAQYRAERDRTLLDLENPRWIGARN